MQESLHHYMRVGIVHFMAFPSTIQGNGPIDETINIICKDDYFSVIEVTWIKDPLVRTKVQEQVAISGLTLTYGAQPRLLTTGQNINSLDESQRLIALENLKNGIDEAYELSAAGFAFLAGKYEEATKELSYKQLIKSTLELCSYAKSKGEMPIILEIFDYDIEKRSLIGPTPLAVRFAQEVTNLVDNFGLMVDLSHIPQLHQSIRENITPLAPYIRHAHIGNAVLSPNQPAYGDQHPRFGFPHSQVGVDEVVEYLRILLEIGYLNKENPPIVSFEVKPWKDEPSELVIANAKRMLNKAWAKV